MIEQVVKITKQERKQEFLAFEKLQQLVCDLKNKPADEHYFSPSEFLLVETLAGRIERTARNRFITVMNALKARKLQSTKEFEMPENVLFLRSLVPGEILDSEIMDQLSEILDSEESKIKTFQSRAKKAGDKAAAGELTIYENRKKMEQLKKHDPERYKEITAARTKNVLAGQKQFQENMTEEQRENLNAQKYKGGLARSKKLSPERRKEIGKLGANARHGKKTT
ncbi:MAG TPA: hypothetical protein PKY82_02565 [Pyrinomonadaceae bacterium]|nr:hypothetical protein [Pyrinomonadaceae bacterium]